MKIMNIANYKEYCLRTIKLEMKKYSNIDLYILQESWNKIKLL